MGTVGCFATCSRLSATLSSAVSMSPEPSLSNLWERSCMRETQQAAATAAMQLPLLCS